MDVGLRCQEVCHYLTLVSTHGHSRPFLPAMIRKNDASAVSKHTADAAKQLSGLNTDMAVPEALDTIMSAMDAASKLKGVGPATATLVLSAYNSENAPFFEDELYAWCLPEKAGSKLKYDKKEYREMFDRVWEVRKRLGEGVSMVHLEKAAFVLQHLDLAEAQDVQALETFAAEEADAGQSSHTANQDNKKHDDSNVLAAYTSRKRPAVEAVGSAKASEDKLQRRSKRAKP